MSDEIRVTRGTPTDEELAAIVGVLMFRTPTDTSEEEPASRWTASARPTTRRLPRPGAGAWRGSALPH